MMRTKFRMVALLAGLISVPAFAAGVYKWVDTQGGIHYSDTAQPGWRRVDVNPTIVEAGALPKSADCPSADDEPTDSGDTDDSGEAAAP